MLLANPPASISPQVMDILKTDPNYVPALMVEGAADEQKSGASGAIKIYQKVLGIYPDFIPAKKRLAILYSEQPSHDRKAYDLAVNVWEASPGDPQVAKALGILSYQQGEYTRAQRLLQENAGADAQALYCLGMAEYQLKQKTESRKTLLRVVKMPLPNDLLDAAKKALAEMK
jgi:tetratricopeptide (TPR) repeat protein